MPEIDRLEMSFLLDDLAKNQLRLGQLEKLIAERGRDNRSAQLLKTMPGSAMCPSFPGRAVWPTTGGSPRDAGTAKRLASGWDACLFSIKSILDLVSHSSNREGRRSKIGLDQRQISPSPNR